MDTSTMIYLASPILCLIISLYFIRLSIKQEQRRQNCLNRFYEVANRILDTEGLNTEQVETVKILSEMIDNRSKAKQIALALKTLESSDDTEEIPMSHPLFDMPEKLKEDYALLFMNFMTTMAYSHFYWGRKIQDRLLMILNKHGAVKPETEYGIRNTLCPERQGFTPRIAA